MNFLERSRAGGRHLVTSLGWVKDEHVSGYLQEAALTDLAAVGELPTTRRTCGTAASSAGPRLWQDGLYTVGRLPIALPCEEILLALRMMRSAHDGAPESKIRRVLPRRQTEQMQHAA